MPRKMGFFSFFLGVVGLACSSFPAHAQGIDSGRHSRALVTQKIDENKRVLLSGNKRPEANAGNDRGAVAEDFQVDHMLLQLKRPAEQEQALQEFIDEQQTEGSPNFHRWITAQEFGERFGLAKQDLDAITNWLQTHGFKVNVVYSSGMVIDFSGTARQVREAFQTEIHHLEVKGEKHVANMSDPQIPAAFAPAVSGIVSLHDFRPRAMYKMHQPKGQYTFPDGFGGNSYAVVPADLATIYNLNPLFSAGYSDRARRLSLSKTQTCSALLTGISSARHSGFPATRRALLRRCTRPLRAEPTTAPLPASSLLMTRRQFWMRNGPALPRRAPP